MKMVLSLPLVILVAHTANAEVYRVGPDFEPKSLLAVASKLRPGDVVEIESGTYREVLRLTANGTKEAPIVIRGTSKARPVFDAEGLNVSGRGSTPRGILQVEGAYYVIERLEFKNARNGENAAGIRLLGSTNTVVRDCRVSGCDMGIFGGDKETATIEACEVAFNGTAEFNSYSHNFYMGGNRVVVRNCHIHDSLYGQNFKSRAHYNELWYNWIADSNEGEVGPVDGKGATDRPNSNMLMVGNIIVSKPNRTGNKAKFILFGSESGGSHDGTLYMFHNTLIAGSPDTIFVQLHDPKARALICNNIFFGSNRILLNAQEPISVTGSNNWMPGDAEVPKAFTDTIVGRDPGFVNAGSRDFHLKPNSPCVGRATGNMEYVDGDGVEHSVSVDRCYAPHLKSAPRTQVGAPDIGGYELESPTALLHTCHRIALQPEMEYGVCIVLDSAFSRVAGWRQQS